MAVGGSGDLLAGMITALLGQKLAPLEAAAAGVWLHGKAGDLAADRLGQYAMLPSDMLDELPRLLK
jgi:NAD(P)H-hydrate epimerase